MPKLPKKVARQNAPTTTSKKNTNSMLEAALGWARLGWAVFPLHPKGKEPLFPSAHPKGVKCRGECGATEGHGVWDATTDPDLIRQWWTERPLANIGGSCRGRIVLDFDYQHGAVKPGNLPPTRTHLSGRGNGNEHLIYQAGGDAGHALKQGKLAQGVDLKAGAAAYVVLPPSTHPETRKPYTVGTDLPEHYLTDQEITEIWEILGAKTPATVRAAAKGISVVVSQTQNDRTPTETGETLASLLQTPPRRGEGQTNDWLTKVAGHYAKQLKYRDAYEQSVRAACALVDPHYEELDKVIDSIWGINQAQHPEQQATADTGWLVGMGRDLYCMARIPGQKRGETTQGLAPYANFNLEARGVMVDNDGKRTYQILLQTRHGDIETTLHTAILSDRRKLTSWLAQYGASIAPHDPEAVRPQMDPSSRLQRYIEAQGAPPVQVVDRLGWDEQTAQFVTHDGAIRQTGAVTVAQSGVIADRSRVDHRTAKYHYGFERDLDEARRVLNEVQTYHHPEVTHLFGAWWAACLLRPQTIRHTSLFPYFGVEAASGSAKTNGYFNLMVQLGGNYHGQIAATKASFRDSAATSNNGILWADDMDNPDTLQEILRAATSGGTIRKMAEDRQAVDFTLSNPLLFTGEELRMSDQKALLERGVLIHPRTPTDRKSLKPGRGHLPQWADIADLQKQYGGERKLTVLAGWYVQEALRNADRFEEILAGFTLEHRGRNADKYAVLRAGARLLDQLLTGEPVDGATSEWVDRWVREEIERKREIEDDSRLTQKVIPWAISTLGIVPLSDPHLVKYARSWDQAPPVLVLEPEADTLDPVEVWVNTRLLAQAWSEARMGRVDTRLETEESFGLQLVQVAYPAASERKSKKISGRVVQYRRLLDPYAELVMARVRGDDLI